MSSVGIATSLTRLQSTTLQHVGMRGLYAPRVRNAQSVAEANSPSTASADVPNASMPISRAAALTTVFVRQSRLMKVHCI